MRELTFVDAAREGLAEEMERDPAVVVLGEGIGKRGGNFKTTLGLYDLYGPGRLRDTPISEAGFTGLCIGAAMTGLRPVVDIMFADFALDALGELVHQASTVRYLSDGRLSVPLVLRGCTGAGLSAGAHHSGSYYPFFMHVPGLKVVAPATPRDAKGLIKSAIRDNDPVVFLEHKRLFNTKGPVPDPDEECIVPLGRAEVVREGADITVIGISLMARYALEAAEVLAGEGVRVEVIDPRSLAPMDIGQILASVKKTGRLLIVDEDYGPCGAGAEIAALVADRGFDFLDAPIRRLNSAFAPRPSSPPLEKALLPDVAAISQAVRGLLGG
ncbi:MAG: alpha-ketoacid dehydrogenase subunit beta [Firmicutes bacterium]|nr:alpha-ketoacid dehydrogenase subunit beta [Bacillota bacterium]